MSRKILVVLIAALALIIALVPVTTQADQPASSSQPIKADTVLLPSLQQIQPQIATLESQIAQFLSDHRISSPDDTDAMGRLSTSERAALSGLLSRYGNLRMLAEEVTSNSKLDAQHPSSQQTASSTMLTSGSIAVNGDSSGDVVLYGSDADCWNHGTGVYLAPVGTWKALTYGDDEADAVSGLNAGYGAAWAWAYAGITIQVTGSGNASANVDTQAWFRGALQTILGGSTDWTLDCIVHDCTCGNNWQWNLAHDSASGLAYWHYKYQFTQADGAIMLQAGHTYRLEMQIETYSSIIGAGSALSDFLSSNYGTWLEQFEITW